MSLDVVFAEATKESQSEVIRALKSDDYNIINAHNTFVNCFVRGDDKDVVLTNIEKTCAPKFYKYCQENPENPYLPHVLELRDFSWGNVVRMERLIALDHLQIDDDAKTVLNSAAPEFVHYMRGETDTERMHMIAETNPLLKKTAQDILKISQAVYYETGGQVLPFCDLKLDNIFLRRNGALNEMVFGDPLFPGSGQSQENMDFMQAAYRVFDMPSLDTSRKFDITLAP